MQILPIKRSLGPFGPRSRPLCLNSLVIFPANSASSVLIVFLSLMRLTWFSLRERVFLVWPWPAVFFLRGSPMVVLVGCRCFSWSFFLRRWWYLPPVGFLPCFML